MIFLKVRIGKRMAETFFQFQQGAGRRQVTRRARQYKMGHTVSIKGKEGLPPPTLRHGRTARQPRR